VISTILMICLVVVIVMIVATLILSEPLPDETPYAAIFARNESGNFTLAHMAGDPLKEGAYRIYVDTINGLIDETANFTGLKDGIWSAGEILTYNGMEELERVVITAMSGGTEMILADLGPGGRSRGTTPTETITPTPTPTDPPDVDFTANITGGNAPLAVQFTDKSAGDVTSWAWNFGDGNTSTAKNPTHTYVTAGAYSVTLTVTGPGGSDTMTKTGYITVLEPPLVANFTANITGGNAPLAVQFTDKGAGDVTSWAWNFGDGNTSAEQDPIHTYESPGNYTVSLNASNDYGFSIETKSDYIRVLEAPEADFNATPTEGNAPLTVRFTDESAGDVTAWLWDFGDGNTSTVQHPNHTYESTGNYTVSLNASNDYGFSIETKSGYISVLKPPTADFTADPTGGNAPLTVQFNDASAGNVTVWLWNFGDGNTSTDQNPIHIYESPGTYTVSLNASNDYGFSIETKTRYITVLEPPVAAFTADPTEGNAPLIVQFTDESAGNVTVWLWDFGDGNTSTDQNPNHTYEGPGNYTVSLTVSNAYSGDTETKIDYITVLEPPGAAFTANVTEGNAPLAVQFTDESTGNVTAWAWDFGDGNTSTDQNPSHTYVSAGNYTATLNASNAYGYSISAPTTIAVLKPPVAAFTTNVTEGNAPLAVQFTDESTGNVTAWAWDFGDGNTSTDQNPSHTYESPGNYTATLNASNAYGYSISAPTTITVLEPPVAAFTAEPIEGNTPLSVQFTDESAGNVTAWAWDFGDGNTSFEQNPNHIYEGPGTYAVVLNASNAYGYSISAPTTIIVLEPPAADFTADPTEGNAPLTVQFTDESAGDVTSWAWDFGDGNTSAEQDPIHTYMTVGTYTVNLTASNAYGTDSKTRVAYIDVTRAQIYEPEPDLNDELDNWTTIGVGEVVVVVDPVYGDVVQMSSTKNHADYSMSRNLSTKGYENITVSFRLAAVGFNNPGDILVVEWFDGALWQELLRIAGKEDPYADGEFHEFSYTLPPSANDNPSFAIRFKLTHQGKEEYVYVDLKNLQITGDPISPS